MATTTRSISHVGDMSTPQVSTCPVSRSMLPSAFNDNAALTLDVVWRVMLGAALAWCGAVVLPVVAPWSLCGGRWRSTPLPLSCP